jgi:hypothetical protein
MLRSMAWRSVSEGVQLHVESAHKTPFSLHGKETEEPLPLSTRTSSCSPAICPAFSLVLQRNAAFDVADALPLQLNL